MDTSVLGLTEAIVSSREEKSCGEPQGERESDVFGTVRYVWEVVEADKRNCENGGEEGDTSIADMVDLLFCG